MEMKSTPYAYCTIHRQAGSTNENCVRFSQPNHNSFPMNISKKLTIISLKLKEAK